MIDKYKITKNDCGCTFVEFSDKRFTVEEVAEILNKSYEIENDPKIISCVYRKIC